MYIYIYIYIYTCMHVFWGAPNGRMPKTSFRFLS